MSGREQILSWLREADAPLSGAELARRLSCSRAAVWKHIDVLRREGHEISGRPSSGYVLEHATDRLDAATLAAHLPSAWARIEWHASIDSTQRRARELAAAGAPEGTVVIAEEQSGGRGRLGRSWHSPAGVNLYCTALLRPSCPPARVASITLVAGLAVADAVAALGALEPKLKWPNDVQLGGRKVAGILTEMQGEVDRVEAVLVGIGVNVNLDAAKLPSDLAETATSLRAELGRPVDRAGFVARLLAALEARYGHFEREGFEPMRNDWQAISALTGQTVDVSGPGGTDRGRVVGIDEHGALILDDGAGMHHVVIAGEVTLRREVRS